MQKKSKTAYAKKKLKVQPRVKIGKTYPYTGRSRAIDGKKVTAVAYEKHSGGIWVEHNGQRRVVSPFPVLRISARDYS